MNFGILRHFARRHGSSRAFSPLLLGALALAATALFPATAAAQTTNCPGLTGGNLSLTQDIVAVSGDPNPCIQITTDNVTVNLGSHKIDISALGNAGVAIDTGNTTGTVIVGTSGTIVTAYTSTTSGVAAITTASSTNLVISGVNIWNTTASCTPGNASSNNQRNQNAGNGMLLNNVTGANISNNDFECYQTGMTISTSAIPRRGTGSVSGNYFINDTYDNTANGTSVASAALVVDNSSGWTIQGNTVSYSGSLDGTSGCYVLDTGCFAAIRLTGSSNGNSVLSNTLFNNFAPGIYTGQFTSQNKIQSNTNSNNPVADLWDDVPPHSSNNWNKNACPDGTLGSVSPQRC